MTAESNDSVERQLRARIQRHGPIPFEQFMDVALYSDQGFFNRGRGAGRAAQDFVTSPQTGSLFGSLVAVYLDREWVALGSPDPFVVIEAGAGDGTLAREILRARPECLTALRYVMVETSGALRAAQCQRVEVVAPEIVFGAHEIEPDDDQPVIVEGTGPVFTQLSGLPARAFDGVIIANELVDNLPFGIAHFDGERWHEVRIGATDVGCIEVLVPLDHDLGESMSAGLAGIPALTDSRVPIDRGATQWVAEAAKCLRRGSLLLVDYFVPIAQIIQRSPHWLRTYADHQSFGADALVDLAGRDITTDVPVEWIEVAARRANLHLEPLVTQAEWLRGLGLDSMVASARERWHDRAHIGDLEAIKARSIVHEADVLTDPDGLGSFLVARMLRTSP